MWDDYARANLNQGEEGFPLTETTTETVQIIELKSVQIDVASLKQALHKVAAFVDEAYEEAWTVLGNGMEAMSIIRYYANSVEKIEVDNLGGVAECLEAIDEYRRTTPDVGASRRALDIEQKISDAFLDLARMRSLLAREILSWFLVTLGKESTREAVKPQTVAETFGTEEALRWAVLLAD